MYQPKIRDELIKRLYRMARALEIPVTRLVNAILEHEMVQLEEGPEHIRELPIEPYRRKQRRKGVSDERASCVPTAFPLAPGHKRYLMDYTLPTAWPQRI
jgi:hypothetical protein